MLLKRPVTLLMTATIAPPQNCPDLSRSDPQVRFKDYFDALKFYTEIDSRVINGIIFAENSNTDLQPMMEIAKYNRYSKNIEFISFVGGNDFPPEYGKGYGEMALMDYAVETSRILQKDSIVWKATGRLILSNIESLIQKSNQQYDLYCDLHNDYPFFKLTHFFDPRFYSFTIDGYATWFKPYTGQLKGAHIEDFFYKIIMKDLYNKRIVPRFKEVPKIQGYVGSTNESYMTLKKRVQRQLQHAIRMFLPQLWI